MHLVSPPHAISAEEGPPARVTISGELDLVSATALQAELASLEESAPDELIIDIRGVTFADSSGVDLLICAQRRAEREGRRLYVTETSPAVQDVLDLCGLRGFFAPPHTLAA